MRTDKAGVALGILPDVVSLLVGPFAIFFAILEIVAAAAYAGARNHLAIAACEALVLGWVLAAVMPIRV